MIKSLVEDLALSFDCLATFSHFLGFTALLLLDVTALISVIQSTSSLNGLDGRSGYLSSLNGCAVSLHHVRYLQLRIFENLYIYIYYIYIYIYIHTGCQEERIKLRESVPYVKL